MNSLIDLIISQLKLFLDLLNINDPNRIYDLFNLNNQNLSKQIASLYEFQKFSNHNSKDSLLLLKEKNENIQSYINKKDIDSLEEQKEIINIINSSNFDLIDNNHNDKESKIAENDISKSKEIIKININEKLKDKKIKEIKKEKLNEIEGYKIKRDKEEKEKIEKKDLIEQEKEKDKGKDLKEKGKNLIKKKQLKENNNNNKIQLKKNSIINKKNQNQKNKIKLIKLENICSTKDLVPKSKFNKKNEEGKFFIMNKKNNKTPSRERDKFKYFLFDDINDDNYNSNMIGKNFIRKKNKAKTVLDTTTFKRAFIINSEEDEKNLISNNYISVNIDKKSFKFKKEKFNSVDEKEKNKNQKLNTNNRYINGYNNKNNNKQYITKTESNKKGKNNNLNININLNNDNFSLDEYLVPYTTKNGEELYLIKSGQVLINKKQKDILENHINNYLYDEESYINETERKNRINKKINNLIPINKNIKEKIKNEKINKKHRSKNDYDTKDKNEAKKGLLSSIKVPLEDLYVNKKKASLFDKSIFKICHRVIDNYKELEKNVNSLTFNSTPNSRSRAKSFNNKKYGK